MNSPHKRTVNEKSKVNLENAFSHYVRNVMSKEIAMAKLEVKKSVKRDTDMLTRSIAEELAGISTDTSDSIHEIESKIENMKSGYLQSLDGLSDIFCKQIENLETSMRNEIKKTTNQLFQSMSKQISKLNVSMIKLSERVHCNEEILHNTRDDNGTISMLLHDFANKISSASPKREQQQNINLDNLESPFSAVKKRKKEHSEIRAS